MTPATLADYVASLDPARGVLVGGRQRRGGGGLFTVEDPANRAVIADVADGNTDDATAAVDAATAAFPAWRDTPPRVRSELLRRAFETMVRDRDQLAALISRENGKAVSDALSEVDYAAEFFRWFAEEAVRAQGDYGPSPAGGTRTVVTRHPVGVAALVTPWNFPAAMATRKLAPALAAGCTVVLKPAAETPLTALAVTRILAEVGVPDGVVNLVPTTDPAGVVGRWLDDPRVRKLSFTGSTRVGTQLLKQAADRVVSCSMELGGNAPFIVTDDADLEAAVAGAMVAKFRNSGQACTAANRFYVHASVHDQFVAQFGATIERLTVGPADTGADVGPLNSGSAVDALAAAVSEAVDAGAHVSHRADVPESKGFFYPPTLLTGVAPDAAILSRELFGPVAPVVRWSDETELVSLVNDSDAGLAAYVYTGDLRRALRLGEALECGMVGINRGLVSDPAAPFGGMKQSGLGREGAHEGLEEFQETQYFSIDWSE